MIDRIFLAGCIVCWYLPLWVFDCRFLSDRFGRSFHKGCALNSSRNRKRERGSTSAIFSFRRCSAGRAMVALFSNFCLFYLWRNSSRLAGEVQTDCRRPVSPSRTLTMHSRTQKEIHETLKMYCK